MLVSVIIVNYNTFRVTCDCIESVIKFTKNIPYEIILVDNASPNDNPDDFLVKFPSITLVKSKENGGFAKGNNLGIEVAKGNIILLLNSDTVLNEDSISIAAGKLQQMPEVGALSVRLIYPDGKLQHTARKFRSIRNEILDVLRPILLLMPYKKRADLMLNQYFHGDYNTYADWVSGAFLMFRKETLDKRPGKKLDERFFMYGEDQLWCYQFHELGYKSYYLAETTVIHIHNASTEPSKQLKLLKKFLELELRIMEYRRGRDVYYQIFIFILTIKEMARYYIKIIIYKLFKHKIR
ncbi:MAG: glycosyltransferase family 2 protein [Flavipsychrobacter sp.]|jgi:GT2 family glycosyltransferase|nr:glycosyltransferase family 2 protein [Flavipsychrobacter sp.]